MTYGTDPGSQQAVIVSLGLRNGSFALRRNDTTQFVKISRVLFIKRATLLLFRTYGGQNFFSFAGTAGFYSTIKLRKSNSGQNAYHNNNYKQFSQCKGAPFL